MFYAFEFKSGRSTTTGEPNSSTGRLSVAGNLTVFQSSNERNAWINAGAETSGMAGNCRESVTVKEARDLHLGMSVNDYNEFVQYLIDDTHDEH